MCCPIVKIAVCERLESVTFRKLIMTYEKCELGCSGKKIYHDGCMCKAALLARDLEASFRWPRSAISVLALIRPHDAGLRISQPCLCSLAFRCAPGRHADQRAAN
jgi:hypothetical protein